VALFDPRSDVWAAHFRCASDGRVAALTPTGRVTAMLLRFNAPARVEVRRELGDLRRWP